MSRNGQTINYVYDAGNKLLQAGNTTFTYDGNGNMVSKTENGQTTAYVYNYEDKMIQVNLPNGSSIVYSYDHSGKRIAKTAGGTTIDYYFDGDDLVTEAQGASILAYYTQGQGLLSQRRNNASYFYHYDGLGSTKALTDANQNIQNTTKYDAWGNILQSSGTITNPYLYVGELGYYGDGDAGMYLLTQRWYNPLVGRFVVWDPIGRGVQRKSLGVYLYTSNNPVNAVDPKGLFCWTWGCNKEKTECKHCFGTTCRGRKECPPRRKKQQPCIEYAKEAIGCLTKGEFELVYNMLLNAVQTPEGVGKIKEAFSPGGSCWMFFSSYCDFQRNPLGQQVDDDIRASCHACCEDIYSAFNVKDLGDCYYLCYKWLGF